MELKPRNIDYNTYYYGNGRHSYVIMELTSGWHVFYDHPKKRICLGMDLKSKEEAEDIYRTHYQEKLSQDLRILERMKEELDKHV